MRLVERIAIVVHRHVERLCVGTELACLQVAPFVAHGAQCPLLAIEGHFHGFGQRSLVVHVERDEHIVLVQDVGHAGIRPYGSLHLAAVHAAKSGKVEQHGLALCLSGCHTQFIVLVVCLHRLGVQVEVLRVHRRRKGADGLAGSTPESGNHVDGKGDGAQTQHDAGHGHGLVDVATDSVFLKLKLADKIEAQRTEDDDPERDKHLSIQYMPAVSQVGHGEKLQRECQFDKAQYHLDGGHP